MRGKLVFAIFSIFSVILTSGFIMATSLECKARDTCLTQETSLFSVYWVEDSHIGPPDYFDNVICCNQTKHSDGKLNSTFRDNSTAGAVCKENQERSILSPYQGEDSHVEKMKSDKYDWEACVFPYVNCTLRNRGCEAGEEGVISMAKNESNSHVMKKQYPLSGLASYWSFDSEDSNNTHAFDVEGPNNGTIKNMDVLRFDGVDDYVEVSNSGSLQWQGPFTLEIWHKSSVDGPQLNKRDGWLKGFDGEMGYRFYIGDTNGNIHEFLTNKSQYHWPWWNEMIDGEWHQTVLTHNGTTFEGYLDGALKGTEEESFTWDSGTGLLQIGRNIVGGDNYFNGKIADVRIYNRSLNSTEIEYAYKHPEEAPFNDTGMVLWHDYSTKTAQDQSGNNNDGTINGAKWTIDGPESGQIQANVSEGYEFDGVDDYVEVPDDASFVIPDGTVEAWAKATTITPDSFVLSKDPAGRYDDISLALTGSDYWGGVPVGHWGFRIQSGTTDYVVYDSTSPSADTWYHLVATWGSGGMKLYVNGNLVDTNSYTGGLDNTEVLSIGSLRSNYGYFNGTIDEVRIYDRALSADEIQSLYEITDDNVRKPRYDWNLCCDVPEPDMNQEVCEWHDGREGHAYQWNSSWVDYQNTGSNPNCCGDEWNQEIVKTRECATGICSDNSTDWTCGDSANDCSYDNKAYDNCDLADVNGDGYNETCYKGEWKLGKERGKIVVTGDVLGWKTAEIIPNANVTVKLVHDKEVLDEETGETDTEGNFRLAVKTVMTKGEKYSIKVETKKEGERSYVEKEFIYHGGAGEWVSACA